MLFRNWYATFVYNYILSYDCMDYGSIICILGRCSERTAPYNCSPVLKENDQACTWDGLKKGKCNIVEFESDIPNPFLQYYDEPNVGGRDSLADYCGFYRYIYII
jgi:hypothetical protein